MSTHVTGFVPPSDMFKKMKEIWDMCEDANVSPPKEVCDFFGDCVPDDAGVEMEILHTEWSADMCSGVEVGLDTIPESVRTIRFYNSW